MCPALRVAGLNGSGGGGSEGERTWLFTLVPGEVGSEGCRVCPTSTPGGGGAGAFFFPPEGRVDVPEFTLDVEQR